MSRHLWSVLRPLLSRRARLGAVLVGAESLAAGLLEAVLLVVVVATALSVAEAGGAVEVPIPVLGSLDLAPTSALLVAGATAASVLLLHAHTAQLTARLSAGVLQRARDRAISAFGSASWEYQSRQREGSLQETVSTLAVQSAAVVTSLGSLAGGCLGLAALLLAAAAVDLAATAVVLVSGGLLFLALRPMARLTRRRSREHIRRNSSFTEEVSQWTSLAMELQVFGVDKVEASRLSAANQATARAFAQSRFATRLGSWLFRDAAVLFLVGAVAVLHSSQGLDLASVGAVVLLVVRSLGHAQAANTAVQAINEQGAALEALTDRLHQLEAAAESPGTTFVHQLERIEFDSVTYDYAPGRPGIAGVSLSIDFGEAVGVIGPSGAGKSTLLQVLLRLRRPSSGRVTVSGVDYRDIAPAAWHDLVALVPQEPRLLQATVGENIAFLRTGIAPQRIEEAAAAAHVVDDIRALPDGFDTELGPRGAGLSGGQKQRIAIARALVGRPQLLVLDEPTSALDVRSEQLLQETISELKGAVTLVIVAHRMATLGCCDRVIAMTGGRILTIGSLEEAVKRVAMTEA